MVMKKTFWYVVLNIQLNNYAIACSRIQSAKNQGVPVSGQRSHDMVGAVAQAAQVRGTPAVPRVKYLKYT